MAAFPSRPMKHERIKKLSRKNRGSDLIKELADMKLNVKSLDKILPNRTKPTASDKNLQSNSRK